MKKTTNDKLINPKVINTYKSNRPVFQFWFEDGILHMWTNERSGLYTISLDEYFEMHFLADVYHNPESGTVYEFKGVHGRKPSVQDSVPGEDQTKVRATSEAKEEHT